MNRILRKNLILLFSLLIVPMFMQAQTYVKSDAAGNNDGTSWENAYTDLQQAIDSTAEGGDIWIAAGTYKPTADATDSIATFAIGKAVNLLGGFAGTETMASERDPSNNKSILSGDIAGDDVMDDFVNNKGDNVLHVVYVDSMITGIVSFDGLDVIGGNTTDDNTLDIYFTAGGGIFTYSTVSINNCAFYNNFGRAGGSIYGSLPPSGNGGAGGSRFVGSTFRNNSATSQSAGLFVSNVSDIMVDNCTFTANSTARGSFYPLFCDDVRLINSNFIENVNLTGTTAGLFAWNNTNFTVRNCNFVENEAQWGAGMFISGNTTNGNTLTMDSCNFDGNIAVNGGGAFYLFASIFEINNTTFTANECDFAATGFHDGDLGVMNNCTWTGNTSARGGATDLVGFLSDVTYNDCLMEENEGGWGAGLFMQNDLTRVSVNRCSFIKNSTTSGGGGGLYALGGSIADVKDCIFESNAASTVGGAINAIEDSINTNVVTVENTTFTLNSAGGQGGAINTGNTELIVKNSVFFQNFADDDGNMPTGRGGAISNNASSYLNATDPAAGFSESDTARMTLINNTFIENDGTLAGDISQWEYQDDTLKANAVMILQNNIFYKSDDVIAPNYAIEAGSPVVISRGGNLNFTEFFSGTEADTSLNQYLTDAKDLISTDPMMVDPFGEDFHLMAGSPCIDAGVAGPDVLDVDIDGDARDSLPDIGADEFILVVSTQELVDNSVLQLTPNPAHAFTQLTLDNDWTGDVRILVVSTSGKTLKSLQLEKPRGIWNYDLDVSDLAAGLYQIAISDGRSVVVKSLVKQ
ncbi:MAG: right-handed parallel beta-helix repeat-containing protein [Bacteroidota bacterium]